MAIISSRHIRHQMCIEELRKLGAKVTTIQGVMFYVKFEIGTTRLAYMYHIKSDNTYYLGRAKPYCMTIGDYETEEDVVDFIKNDLEHFKNAMNSKNFDEFIEIDQSVTKLVRNFEDLYLYYNVPKGDIDDIKKEVEEIIGRIDEVKSRSKLIYNIPLILEK